MPIYLTSTGGPDNPVTAIGRTPQSVGWRLTFPDIYLTTRGRGSRWNATNKRDATSVLGSAFNSIVARTVVQDEYRHWLWQGQRQNNAPFMRIHGQRIHPTKGLVICAIHAPIADLYMAPACEERILHQPTPLVSNL